MISWSEVVVRVLFDVTNALILEAFEGDLLVNLIQCLEMLGVPDLIING